MAVLDAEAKRSWVGRVLNVNIPAQDPHHQPDPGSAIPKRLAELTNAVRAAGAPKDLVDLLRAANTAHHANDPALATKHLDDVAARLATHGAPLDRADPVSKRLAALTERVRAVGAPHDLVDDLRAANAALHANDPALATQLLDEVEARLASRARAAEAAAEIARAAPSDKVGVVDFAKIRLAWDATRDARTVALGAMKQVCDAMLEDTFIKAEPDYPAIVQATKRIGELMPALPAIDDLLDAMANAEGDARTDARDKALGAVRDYGAAIEAVDALKSLQSIPTCPAAIYDPIAGAVANLQAALAG